jgi:hypothetical protein
LSAFDLNKNIMVITTNIIIILDSTNIANYSSYIYESSHTPQIVMNPIHGSRKMNMMIFPVFAAVLALMLTTPLSGYASGSTSSSSNQTLTPDEKAAGGPLTGNLSQVAEQHYLR